MKFVIQHQTSSYMRLRLNGGRFTRTEAEVLEYALSNLKGVSGVRLYPASGGIAFSYKGCSFPHRSSWDIICTS